MGTAAPWSINNLARQLQALGGVEGARAAPPSLAPWDVLASGTEGQQGQASRSKAQKADIVPQPGNSWGRSSPLGLPFVWAEALKATDIYPGPFPFMTPQAVPGLEARASQGLLHSSVGTP